MATTTTNSSLAQFLDYWAPASTSDSPTASSKPISSPDQLPRLEVVHVSPTLPTSAGDKKVYPLVGTDLHGRLFVVRFISLSTIASKVQKVDVIGARVIILTSASSGTDASTLETKHVHPHLALAIMRRCRDSFFEVFRP